jgi:xanthosine utilization system XapX-like protein
MSSSSNLFAPVVAVVGLVGAVVGVVSVVVEDAARVVADAEVRVEDQVRWAAADVDDAWG